MQEQHISGSDVFQDDLELLTAEDLDESGGAVAAGWCLGSAGTFGCPSSASSYGCLT